MQENKYSIKEWAKDDQPREKLLNRGAGNLSNSELLAILLLNGTQTRTALDVAKDVMKLGKDSLSELGKLSLKDFMKINGIGYAKAVTIAASMELGRRHQSTVSLEKKCVSASADIAGYLRPILKDYRHEIFAVLFLNQANKITHFEIISEGGITCTVADPRIILKRALEENAVNVILCHNHPSGSLRPSLADIELTKKVREAASLLDIRILDHIIVSEEGYYSFADEGLL